MSDKERILSHIREHGSITQREAFLSFGCMRLASRINDLRKDGYNIATEMETGVDRYGERDRYARYFLREEDA